MLPSVIVSTIDKKIKTRFNLFQGKRSAEEDQKIYDELYELCFDEFIRTIEEKLEDSKKVIVLDQIDSIMRSSLAEQKKHEMIVEILLNQVSQNPRFRFELETRLLYFMETLPL